MYDITSVYAIVLTLIFLVLSARVILVRRSSGIALGSEGDQTVLHKVRVHGNFAEYVPFTLVLFLLAEGQGAAPLLLHVSGSMLVISRLLHAYAVDQSIQKIGYRVGGMVLTITSITLLVVSLLLSLW